MRLMRKQLFYPDLSKKAAPAIDMYPEFWTHIYELG